MGIDPGYFNNFFLVLAAWSGAFLAALWLSLVLWTYRDIRRRARDPLARILAVLVTAVLFIPGIVIYLILRPSQTLEDEYQQTLEEEALLQSIEESSICPGCSRRIKDNWILCPNCHTKLKKSCQACSRLMELPWNLCPYCGTAVPGMRREGLSVDEILRPIPLESEKESSQAVPSDIEQEPEETLSALESIDSD